MAASARAVANFRLIGSNYLAWPWLISEVGSMALTALLYALFAMLIKPRKAPIQPEELYKYAYLHKERQIIEDWVAIVVAVVSMSLIIPFFISLRFLKKWDWRAILDDTVVFIVAYVQGNLITLTLVEMLKRTVCRPRPDFLSRCLNTVDPDVIDAYIATHRHGTVVNCPGMDESSKLISDGRLSFPSGHSAGFMFSYLFLAMYGYQRMIPYDRIGYFRIGLPGCLLLFPLFVMVSRVMDNRHNPLDVLVGGLLGGVIAVVTYNYYFPFYHKPLVIPSKSYRACPTCGPYLPSFKKSRTLLYSVDAGTDNPRTNFYVKYPATTTQDDGAPLPGGTGDTCYVNVHQNESAPETRTGHQDIGGTPALP